MPEGLDPNHEPPFDPFDDAQPFNIEPPFSDDDTNPSQAIQAVDLSNEPPINPDDTNPSRAMAAVDLSSEPPINPDDTNPSQAMQTVDLSSEPPINPDDTNPSRAMAAVDLSGEPMIRVDDTNPSLAMRPTETQTLAGWRRAMGVISLLLAIVLTIGALIITFLPQQSAPVEEPTMEPTAAEVGLVLTVMATETEFVIPSPFPESESADVVRTTALLPTLSPEQAAAILAEPIINTNSEESLQVVRNPYDPFTIIPERPRGEVIEYTVEQGDTIFSIAEQFWLGAGVSGLGEQPRYCAGNFSRRRYQHCAGKWRLCHACWHKHDSGLCQSLFYQRPVRHHQLGVQS